MIEFFGGDNLKQVENDEIKYTTLTKKYKQKYLTDYLEIFKKTVEILTKKYKNKDFLLMGDSQQEEEKNLQEYIKDSNEWILYTFYLNKTIACYFFQDLYQAVANYV